jgi:hypothetical protein
VDDRVTPYGLSCPDVVEYLPASMLVPGGPDDWATLHREFADRQGQAKNITYFKDWLREAREAKFDEESLRAAARTVGVPEEVRALLEALLSAVRP